MQQFLESRRAGADAAFRVFLSGIFVVAGLNHLLKTDAVVGRLLAAPFADLATLVAPAAVLVVATGVVLLLGGLALLTGFRTRWTALLLMAALVPISATVQLAPGQVGPLFKNVAIFGGLLHFLFAGGGAWSVDALLAARRERAPTPAAEAAG